VTGRLSDSWFLYSAHRRSGSLCRLGIELSRLAYRAEATVVGGLREMGFDGVSTYGYGKPSQESDDTAAFSLAQKDLSVQGGAFTLVLVCVRGTVENEWFSNFRLGSGKRHEGFAKAAGQVQAALQGHLSKHRLDRDKVKLFITGHSRGGAVANLLAGELCQSGICPESGNVYAYTYAAPNVTRGPRKAYGNIFNYVFEGDYIPHVPLSGLGWGYGKYGRDITLKATPESRAIFQRLTGDRFDGFSVWGRDALLDALRAIAPTRFEYGIPPAREIFHQLAKLLSQGRSGPIAVETPEDLAGDRQLKKALRRLKQLGSEKLRDSHCPECYAALAECL